ncbi:hypothetical protein [Telluribacter humicola]|uniref:hypothetical protein n=1 Tax=Telluribacter humicola TaxID=1720261 RepID=UPI001A966A28|nr:hypothetical protein [Telluribacter humicola]
MSIDTYDDDDWEAFDDDDDDEIIEVEAYPVRGWECLICTHQQGPKQDKTCEHCGHSDLDPISDRPLSPL